MLVLRLRGSTGGRPSSAFLTGSDTFCTPCESQQQMEQLLASGHSVRAFGETKLNERSSRSHAVITIQCTPPRVELLPPTASSCAMSCAIACAIACAMGCSRGMCHGMQPWHVPWHAADERGLPWTV